MTIKKAMERQLSVRVNFEIWQAIAAAAERDRRTTADITRIVFDDWAHGAGWAAGQTGQQQAIV
jgi:acetyl-CoA carboxylase alpha subunit